MATLIFCFVEVIVCVRVVIPVLANLNFPTWTYRFNAKPLLLISKPMMSSLKGQAYIIQMEGIERKTYVGVIWGMIPSFWLTLHLVEPDCTLLLLFYVIMWFSPQHVGVQI